MIVPTARLGRVDVHDITSDAAVALIARWAEEGSGGYVCTPNVDHVVKASRDEAFRSALAAARLRLPDGMGIVYGSRIAGRSLRGTVTGRLLPQIIGQRLGERGLAVALVGGRPGSVGVAARRLEAQGARVAAALEPRMGLRVGSAEDTTLVAQLVASDARVIFVGFGAPKQELWMARHAAELPEAVLIGVGQAIDVLAGRAREAPRWATRIGLEWMFRLASEPRRLWRRYLWDDPRFFWWMLRQRFRGSGHPVVKGEHGHE